MASHSSPLTEIQCAHYTDCTVHTTNYKLHRMYSANCTLQTTNCTLQRLYTEHYILQTKQTVQCTLQTAYYTECNLHTAHYTDCTRTILPCLLSAEFWLHCTLHRLYTAHCTLHRLYTAHFTLHRLLWRMLNTCGLTQLTRGQFKHSWRSFELYYRKKRNMNYMESSYNDLSLLVPFLPLSFAKNKE